MPEVGEVRIITNKLRERLKGRSFLWFDLIDTKNYAPHIQGVMSQVGHLFPSVCLDILCRGKQLFFFFENGLAFISSLGVYGHWLYLTTENRNAYLTNKNHAQFGLHFGKQMGRFNVSEAEIWYDDQRSFGNFTITNWEGAKQKMLEFGPDLLTTMIPFKDIHPIVQQILPREFFEQATLDRFIREVRAPRRGKMKLCVFLLKQNYLSGIGNYLKSEILYRARLSPFRELGTLTDLQIQTLHSMILTTIVEAFQFGGLTHGNFLDPDMKKGTFPIYVYKRKGELDLNGFVIRFVGEKESADGRGTYYVPEVQL